MSINVTVNEGELNRLVKAIALESGKELEPIVKKVGLDAMKLIMLRWPVDTGRSRAGWFPAAQFVGHPLPPLTTIEMAEGVSKGRVEVDRSSSRFALTLINAVEYAIFLEMGRSRQAPHGAVRISLQEVKQHLKHEVLPKLREAVERGKRRGR